MATMASNAKSVPGDSKDSAQCGLNNKYSCDLAERCVNGCATYGKVCPYAAHIASTAACEAIAKLSVDSRIFPQEKISFTYVEPDDVVIGSKLGHGGFSNVSQCVLTSGKDAGQELAMKYLRKQVMVDLHSFKHGAMDLAVESYFLHVLDHQNIIKLHGITAGSVEKLLASGKEGGFFLVIDRLYDTLDQKIEAWTEERERQGLLSRWSPDFKDRKKKELLERLRLAYLIADALEYLHSLNIVYRDLKPDNIGFDKDGVLKLFDFGLAKELKERDDKLDGTYELTGNTGSRRYMAPEIGKELSYNQSVDVYSFGILLWEMCSSEKPFHGFSSAKHMEHVVLGGERPSMDSHHTAYWPVNLQWLMNRCWSDSPSDRPSFTSVKKLIRDLIECREEPLPSLGKLNVSQEEEKEKDDILPSDFSPSSPNMRGSLFGLKSIKPLSASSRGRSKTWGFTSKR